MSHTTLSAFDSTVQTTNGWLHEVMDELHWDDRHRSYRALRVVLHALRDRLGVDQAAALGAQLPMLVRGFYYEGWHPGDKPRKERHKQDFLAHVRAAFPDDPAVNPEEVTRSVLEVLARHVTPGEIRHIKNALPAEIRSLCPERIRTLWD